MDSQVGVASYPQGLGLSLAWACLAEGLSPPHRGLEGSGFLLVSEGSAGMMSTAEDVVRLAECLPKIQEARTASSLAT